MARQIPIINMEWSEFKEVAWTKIREPNTQRKIILVIVSIALLLDNMLYMVIVPIIPDYLRYTGAFGTPPPVIGPNGTLVPGHGHEGQDRATGILFASKAIVQLMVNPFSGVLIDRIGYDIPMMIGLTIMFLSTLAFACGRSYGSLFFARSLQGVGSAFADTSGLAMIADRFTEEGERSKALGIALAFISFGCLVAPPFGGSLYEFAGKEVPFLILAFVSLADSFGLLLVMKPIKEQLRDSQRDKQQTNVPIWRLFIDPYIAVCAGALMMSNVALAFLEPTISLWMEDNITTDKWKIGMVWLPAFIPHVFGVIITVKMAKQYPQYQWMMACIGLVMEGLCCFLVPLCTSYIMLMLPICGICFGIALIDTALLPTLGYLVDVRYVSVYGSIYAIADISYSMAYAIGPIIAGGIVEAIGFTALNCSIAIANLLYAPALYYLRNIYDFKPFESEANILMSDPPDKKYQTYAMHDATSANPTEVSGEVKNHLEYARYQETNVDNSTAGEEQYQQGYQQGYQQQQPSYQQPPPQQQQPYQRPAAQPQQQQASRDTNPFRRINLNPPPCADFHLLCPLPFSRLAGWKDAIWSLPKRLFQAVPGAVNENSAFGSGDDANFPSEGAELPKLPVPSLEQTLAKYLQFARVILSDAQFERTRRVVHEFEADEGPKLQAILLERRDDQDNWAYNWWLNDMYLGNQLALPVNSNPGMVFPPRPGMNLAEQAALASRLASGLLKHKEVLDHGGIPQERATSREKGQPLCMTQFYRLLTSCRVPSQPRDMQLTEPCSPNSHEHIIVTCKNQFYVVNVKKDGCAVNEEELSARIQGVIQDAHSRRSRNALQPAVGLLTSDGRDTWAQVREELAQNDTNCDNMELIQRSLAIICMDDALPASFNYRILRDNAKGHKVGERDETNMLHQMIHGGGSNFNSGNRWFDKTIQVILGNDGAWGLCYEHSPAEGVAVVQLMEQLLKQAKEPLAYANTPLPAPQPLQWQLSGPLHHHIQNAANNVNSLLEDLDLYVYRFSKYGKDFIKSCKVSPDAYIQLALQLAYYRLNQRLTATYESASTRRFRMGRVDCIRSASLEALNWVEAMCQAELDNEGRRVTFSVADEKCLRLFDAAITKQTAEMVDNILGQGVDIHLLGLRQAAKENFNVEPALFADEAFAKMNHFALSTSQVATACDGFMGYGPVVADGYGASYNPRPDGVTFCLSAFHSSQSTSTWKFANSLEKSLLSMQQLLEAKTKNQS